jgi:hypothetical protein
MQNPTRVSRPLALIIGLTFPADLHAQHKYTDANGSLRVALSKQPFSPNGASRGPATMAEGGIRAILEVIGATIRTAEAGLTPEEDTE